MQRVIPHDATGVLISLPNVGHMLVYGLTKPSDATAGFAPGCIFIDTDASAGAQIFVNEGTVASCDFDLLLADGDTVAALTVTAGTITTLSSTTGTIATLNSTTGNIAALSATSVAVSSTVTMSDGANLIGGTGTGTKIGSSTAQKFAFFASTPVAQQSTTGTTTGFGAGSTSTVFKDSTFTGGSGSSAYTVGDMVLALKNLGLMKA